MRVFLIISTIFCVALSPSPAYAGPFGLTFGKDPEDYGCMKAGPPGFYVCDDVPQAHSAFDVYAVQAGPKLGICFIKALGKQRAPLDVASLRAEVDEIANALAKKYGAFTEKLDLTPGADRNLELWIWMPGRSQLEELGFMYRYILAEVPAEPKIELILVYLQADESDHGNIVIEYSGSDSGACEEDLRKADEARKEADLDAL